MAEEGPDPVRTASVGSEPRSSRRSGSQSSVSVEKVIDLISKDQAAADVKLSLFSAALYSYRYDSVLRPFPPMFTVDGEKDIDSLRAVFLKFPGIDRFCKGGLEDEKLVALLHWLLNEQPVTLRTKDRETTFAEIEARTGRTQYSVAPDYIFQVDHHPSSVAASKFEQLTSTFKTLLAYHGSRIENFHSIVHSGLHAHLNKTSLFGYGTYLSTAQSVSMAYSPAGSTWQGSQLGAGMSVIAVCEVLDHPAVKRSEEDQVTSEASNAVRKQRGTAEESMTLDGKIPDKYLVVRNNEHLRLAYLLVYADRRNTRVGTTSGVVRFCQQHSFLLMMFCYVLILMLVGFVRSDVYRRWTSSLDEL